MHNIGRNILKIIIKDENKHWYYWYATEAFGDIIFEGCSGAYVNGYIKLYRDDND